MVGEQGPAGQSKNEKHVRMHVMLIASIIQTRVRETTSAAVPHEPKGRPFYADMLDGPARHSSLAVSAFRALGPFCSGCAADLEACGVRSRPLPREGPRRRPVVPHPDQCMCQGHRKRC
jgi:hypothetical protein